MKQAIILIPDDEDELKEMLSRLFLEHVCNEHELTIIG